MTATENLVTLGTLSPDYRTMVEGALATRNKERLLSGLEKYESLEAMIDAYVEFEGREKLSRDECEDAVIRFLQRKALLAEGQSDGGPQEFVTFGLLLALVGGVAFGYAKNGISV